MYYLKLLQKNGGAIKKIYTSKNKPKKRKEKNCKRYGVFPCQDTILPLFFEELYNDVDFEVEFTTFKDWNAGLEAFQNDKIDVALHNFPTTVAFNSELKNQSRSFLLPFFSFKGYSLWVRTTALNEFITKYGVIKSTFDVWSKEEKKNSFWKLKS